MINRQMPPEMASQGQATKGWEEHGLHTGRGVGMGGGTRERPSDILGEWSHQDSGSGSENIYGAPKNYQTLPSME